MKKNTILNIYVFKSRFHTLNNDKTIDKNVSICPTLVFLTDETSLDKVVNKNISSFPCTMYNLVTDIFHGEKMEKYPFYIMTY